MAEEIRRREMAETAKREEAVRLREAGGAAAT